MLFANSDRSNLALVQTLANLLAMCLSMYLLAIDGLAMAAKN
jgi:hypothetical protein